MSINRYYIRAKNRAAWNFNSHQLEQLFATSWVRVTFHDTVFYSELKLPTSDIATASHQQWLYPLQCPPQTKLSPVSQTARFQKAHWNRITKAWWNWGTRWMRITPQSHPVEKEVLTVKPDAVYAIVAPGTAFVVPADPGPLVIPSGTNIITSGNLNRDDSEAVREFKEWVNLERTGGGNCGSSEQNFSFRSFWP